MSYFSIQDNIMSKENEEIPSYKDIYGESSENNITIPDEWNETLNNIRSNNKK